MPQSPVTSKKNLAALVPPPRDQLGKSINNSPKQTVNKAGKLRSSSSDEDNKQRTKVNSSPQSSNKSSGAGVVSRFGGRLVRDSGGHVTEVDFVNFQPHTIFGGLLLFSALFVLYFKYYLPADHYGNTAVMNNAKLGIFGALWSLVAFGMLHFPDGIMVRPHPIVWRALMACMVIYMMIIIFFLFQDYKTTRLIIDWYEPGSIVDAPERSYAEDCRMSTPERPWLLVETIFDEFLLAHLLGYWGKMLILRDWRMAMFISFGFEIIELTYQYMLPNFAECWWDHVIADLIVCNAGGAFLGWLTLRLVGAQEYDFVALSDIRSVPGKAKRLALQLIPRSLDRFQWEMFDSFKRFCQIVVLLGLMLAADMNSFVTKLLWNLKPTHHLVCLRLVIVGFSGISGVREYYEWVSGRQKHATRIGIMAWLIIFVFLLETLWCVKMIQESDHKYFRSKMPAHVGVPWMVVIPLFIFWVVAFFSTKNFRQQKTFGAWLWRGIISGVLYLALLIILAMCLMACPDLQWGRREFDEWATSNGIWSNN